MVLKILRGAEVKRSGLSQKVGEASLAELSGVRKFAEPKFLGGHSRKRTLSEGPTCPELIRNP